MIRSKIAKVTEWFGVSLILAMLLFTAMSMFLMAYFSEWYLGLEVLNWLAQCIISVFKQDSLPPYPTVLSTKMYVMTGTLLFSVFTSTWIVWFFRIRNFEDSIFKHIDGPRMLSHRRAKKHYRKAVKRSERTGLLLHPDIRIPGNYEIGNFLIWGMQGAGKSNLIKSLVDQVIKRDEKAVIYDIKGEYTELFLDGNVSLLSPRDDRSVSWVLGQDIVDLGLAEVFAESVISSTATNESFWVDSARVVLIGVIVGLISEGKEWSWQELSVRLFASDEKLSLYLKKHYPPAATLICPNDKTTVSIRSMIATQLSWIRRLGNFQSNSIEQFSISSWLNDSARKSLIVKSDINSPLMSQAMLTAALSILSTYVLSRSDEEAEPIWLIIDELATINKNKSIEHWLAQGRSKGCRAIVGVQLLSQVYSIFGEHDANTLLGLFANVVTFRLAISGEAKNAASKAFGNRRVEYRSESINADGDKSISFPQENISVVTPEEIASLPQANAKDGVAGFLQIGGISAAYRLNWPITKGLQKTAKASVPRKIQTSELQSSQGMRKNRLNRRLAK